MNDKMIVKNFYERIVSENRLEELSKYVSENCALTLGDKNCTFGVGRHEATSNIRKKDLSRLYNENSTSIQ